MIHTEVFHIYSALVPQARPVNRNIFGIRNHTTVAALGDSQSMDGKACFRRESVVQVCSRSVGANCSLVREFFDGFP